MKKSNSIQKTTTAVEFKPLLADSDHHYCWYERAEFIFSPYELSAEKITFSLYDGIKTFSLSKFKGIGKISELSDEELKKYLIRRNIWGSIHYQTRTESGKFYTDARECFYGLMDIYWYPKKAKKLDYYVYVKWNRRGHFC